MKDGFEYGQLVPVEEFEYSNDEAKVAAQERDISASREKAWRCPNLVFQL